MVDEPFWCLGKTAFLDKRDALRVLRERKARAKSRRARHKEHSTLEAYRCGACGNWHLGRRGR